MKRENSEHRQLIIDFYTAFQRLDWRGMNQCYHPEVCFSDPVFAELNASEVTNMWHMLCDSANEFVLHFDHIQAGDTHGSAHWTVQYNYPSRNGGEQRRRVKNDVFAEFQFADGQICRHTDHFNFWRWSAQALGPAGLFLGWSGRFRNKVQQRAGRSLGRFKRLNDAERGTQDSSGS